MRAGWFLFLLLISFRVAAQRDGDSSMARCPVYITDTVSAHNFFLEFQPSVLKVYRVKGKLTMQIQQKDQFFTLFFHDKKLKNSVYKIGSGNNNKNVVEAKYSFRSGGHASFVNVSNGTVEAVFDKIHQRWNVIIKGRMANLVERSVTWYKVNAAFFVM